MVASASNVRIRNRRSNLHPFPVNTLKRVDRPTNLITEDKIQRQDEQENGFYRALRGDFGPYLKGEMVKMRFVRKHPLSRSNFKMGSAHIKLVDSPVAPEKAPLPDDPELLSLHIKETAYFLRADLVGICELPPYAVYSHSFPDGEQIDLKHKYAIAILIDQDYRTSEASTGRDWISNAMSFMAYSTSAFIACTLADYIRRLGYPARAHHALNYQVVVPPILVWAGLGEMSRIGEIVVNPFLGPRFKAAIVTTDLPLVPDKPIDFGLQDFCSKCGKCARECPSGAISDGDKVIQNGYERWPLDVEKCTGMRVGNKGGAGCGVCIKVCPWNKPFTPFHRSISWTMRHIPVARRLAVWGDDIMGYGKPKPDNQWWLDLEEVDGILKIPTPKEEHFFLDKKILV